MTSPPNSVLPPGASPVADFDRAWALDSAGPRLRAIRVAAERVRDRFGAGPRAIAVRTLPLVAAPYPTKYAFSGAAISPAPYIVFTHRCLVVQFLQGGELRTLLFNPTDVPGARSTPYLARMAARIPVRLQRAIAREHEPLTDQLAQLGIAPDDVDYVAYDNLHVQDLRPILGTEDDRILPRFPRASLLVPASEWTDWDDLHPLQRAWYVRHGKLGVRTRRIILTARDFSLGDGVMLVRTPGRTSGNQTLFLNTDAGVWGVSENGTCADNWSPMDSRIAGLRSLCRKFDLEVVSNGNTLERAADQYTSMILERTLVDRVRRAPAFVQMFPPSEVTPSALSPGLKPTILHRSVTHGEIASKRPSSTRSAAGIRAAE